MLIYRWINKQTNRYYRILISQDLLGHWVVTKVWGGINQKTGRIVHIPCNSLELAKQCANKVANTRRLHGYILYDEFDQPVEL